MSQVCPKIVCESGPRSEMCCMQLAWNTGCVLHTFPQYGKLCPINGCNMLANLGHTSKFQQVSRLAFITAATSLTGGQPNFARCLAISWAGTLYTFLGTLVPFPNFAQCNIHFTSKSCILLYWQRYYTALQQRASAKLRGVVQGMELRNFRRGRHLYSHHSILPWSYN